MNNWLIQFIKFGGVGGVMLALSMSCYYVAFEIYDFPLYTTFILLYCVFILISYLLNAKFTFKQKPSKIHVIKYYIVYLLGLVFGLGILALLNEYTDYSKFVITLIQIVPRTFVTFILTKLIVFNSPVE